MAKAAQATYKKVFSVKDLVDKVFVRTKRDDDRAEFFIELYMAKPGSIPPPLVTEEGEIIDGRNRIHALRIMEQETIECEVVRGHLTMADMIAMAFNANVSTAPLPPTVDDCVYVVEQLIASGVGPRRMPLMLPSIPLELLKKYMKAARAKIEKRKVRAALADLAEGGMSLAAAAQRHGVDVDKVKREFQRQSGEIEREKASHKAKWSRVGSMFRSLSQTVSRNATALSESLEVGEINEPDGREFFEACHGWLTNVQKVIDDSRRRYEKKAELIRKEIEPTEARMSETSMSEAARG